MVIFTARQNLANLNEVKMNLIVKFVNFDGKSYITRLQVEKARYSQWRIQGGGGRNRRAP